MKIKTQLELLLSQFKFKSQKLLMIGLLLSVPFVEAQNMYQPLTSPERQELSSGFSLDIKTWGQGFSRKNLPVLFLKYTFYLTEINHLIPPSYKNIFVPGLSAGINLFKSEIQSEYNICKPKFHSSAYHLGLRGKIPYFSLLQPFAEGGLARGFCYSRDHSEVEHSNKELSHYFSYGLFLSLKFLDRSAIYALDQDYGINDVGLKAECLHYQFKNKTNKSFDLCQFGLQFNF